MAKTAQAHQTPTTYQTVTLHFRVGKCNWPVGYGWVPSTFQMTLSNSYVQPSLNAVKVLETTGSKWHHSKMEEGHPMYNELCLWQEINFSCVKPLRLWDLSVATKRISLPWLIQNHLSLWIFWSYRVRGSMDIAFLLLLKKKKTRQRGNDWDEIEGKTSWLSIVLRHRNDLPMDNSGILLIRTGSVNLLIIILLSVKRYIFKAFFSW